jgi:hypothetical protein
MPTTGHLELTKERNTGQAYLSGVTSGSTEVGAIYTKPVSLSTKKSSTKDDESSLLGEKVTNEQDGLEDHGHRRRW